MGKWGCVQGGGREGGAEPLWKIGLCDLHIHIAAH